MNNFKLIAKILKQYPAQSEDRAVARFAISTLQQNYTDKILTLKLQQLVDEAA